MTTLSIEPAVASSIDVSLTEAERTNANLHLQRTKLLITKAIEGLSDSQWKFLQTTGRWSIGEIVEHVVLVLRLLPGPMRQQLAAAPAPPLDRDYRQVDTIIVAQFPDRTARYEAQEMES